MQITDIKTFLVHPGKAKNLCFVKIETDEGIYGWGECYTQSDRDVQITAHVDQLKRYLIGRDPTNIKHFTQMAFDDFAGRRGAMDYYCAISGLEHAMWDIAGKAYGAPVHKLIGGACRDKIRVYANGWSGGNPTPDSLAERASEVIEAGFTALKFDPIPGRWRTYRQQGCGGRRRGERARRPRSSRTRRGYPRGDAPPTCAHARCPHCPRNRAVPSLLVRRTHSRREHIPALASVRQKINIPVVTGEELYTKFEFREVFERQAADILNPDVCNVGGILELKEIAAMAEPYFVVISPHNFNSTTVGLAATIQVSAAIPNFLITEYFVNLEELGRDIAKTPFEVQDGYIQIPDTPGLGIDLDEERLAAYPYKPFPARSPAQIWDEGP